MTDTIERAARAMHQTVQPEWAWDEPDAELYRRMYRANALAVLAEIREPGIAIDVEALRHWQATIDAILAQEAG